MTRARSTTSFALCASLLALVAARGDEHARACGFFAEPLEDGLTFDDGPWHPVAATECIGDCAMLADWHDWFQSSARDDAEWKVTLLQATEDKLSKLVKTVRPGKLRDALAYVQLARRLEPSATLLRSDDKGVPIQPPSPALVNELRAGFNGVKDPFLRQRYGYQVVRALFYQRDWRAAIAFFDQNVPALAQPSAWLAAQTRWYVAGALKRAGSRGRASLELARIHFASADLADATLVDFRPMEQGDWKEALGLAKDPRDKILLWALVGVSQRDGLTAASEIAKIDPKSERLGELIVAELARTDKLVAPSLDKPDPKDVAAQRKAYAALDALVTRLIATPGVDRPWLLELVACHIAAKRGDVGAARAHASKAIAQGGRDPHVASQARASLALALARDWQINPQHEDELAKDIAGIDPKLSVLAAVRENVRIVLAKAYAKAGKLVEAEYLKPSSVDRWTDVKFVNDMIARRNRAAGDWDRFVLDGPYSAQRLATELALRLVLDGDFAGAQRAFSPAGDGPLGTDPFVLHIRDCHDCDHEKYANAKWTRGSLIVKLVDLARAANGTGDPAAKAAIDIGAALYNITWHGNARVVLDGTNQETQDTRAALRWFQRAYDLARDRELKAHAALYAAKAELAISLSAILAGKDNAGFVAKTWYPIVEKYKDTKYYKEILHECGYFVTWSASRH